LLRLIGSLIRDPQRAGADDEPSRVRTGMEWSNSEISELGDMLIALRPLDRLQYLVVERKYQPVPSASQTTSR
jgi:hypothetical protein